MNCKKIKELILTDYIDNEMSSEEKIRLNIHFARCPGCRKFFDTAKNTVVKPFADAKRIVLPEFIWSRVKESIMAGQQKKAGFLVGVLEKLKPFFYIPRPALAVSTIMALAVIAVLTTTSRFNNKEGLKTDSEEQPEYSTYSIEAPVSSVLNNGGGFGTLVEEYFL